jgi:hypothetical protein
MIVKKICEFERFFHFPGGDWNPHKVELAVWTHYVLNELKPEVLMDMPGATSAETAKPVVTSAPIVSSAPSNGASEEAKNVANGEDSNSTSESANGDDVKNGVNDFSSDENDVNNDLASSAEESTVSEIHLPASNGSDVGNDVVADVHENGKKEVSKQTFHFWGLCCPEAIALKLFTVVLNKFL